jgi:hypothetical protein
MCQQTLDSLAEWFLRLNGFFTVLNFVVHPASTAEGTLQRTDADVLGVRFPDRREVVGGVALRDHTLFANSARTQMVIAEVTAGTCKLNGPWTRSEDQNVDHVIRSMGCVRDEEVSSLSRALYRTGHFESGHFAATLICFGTRVSSRLPESVNQITWAEVFGFVYDRYQEFWRAKLQHQQWPPVGRLLWDRSVRRQRDEYIHDMQVFYDISGHVTQPPPAAR